MKCYIVEFEDKYGTFTYQIYSDGVISDDEIKAAVVRSCDHDGVYLDMSTLWVAYSFDIKPGLAVLMSEPE